MSVTLKQLRALREVAETRNFTAAAKRLRTTQPALSASISQLEQALDIKLIDRTTRRFALTNAGIEFLPAITRILADLDSAIRNLTTLAALKRGSVIVGCAPAIVMSVLAKPIAGFRKRYPHINVIVKDAVGGASLGKLKSGEVEIAVASLPKPDPEFSAVPLFDDPIIAIVPKSSPMARKRSMTWRSLADYPIIAPSKESNFRDCIEQTYVKATGKRLVPAFEPSYWRTGAALVEAEMGIAIAPSHSMEKYSSKDIQVVALTQPTVTRSINIITHRERMLSPAASAFVEYLIGRIGKA